MNIRDRAIAGAKFCVIWLNVVMPFIFLWRALTGKLCDCPWRQQWHGLFYAELMDSKFGYRHAFTENISNWGSQISIREFDDILKNTFDIAIAKHTPHPPPPICHT